MTLQAHIRYRILMIDDSVTFLQAVMDLLAREPRVEMVGAIYNEHEVAERVKTLLPDVILFDYEMRNFKGSEALRTLKEWAPAGTIIALTIQNNAYYRAAVLKAGADEFVCKDSIFKDLIPTIFRVQEKKLLNA